MAQWHRNIALANPTLRSVSRFGLMTRLEPGHVGAKDPSAAPVGDSELNGSRDAALFPNRVEMNAGAM